MSYMLSEWIVIIQKPVLNSCELNTVTSGLSKASIELHTAGSF